MKKLAYLVAVLLSTPCFATEGFQSNTVEVGFSNLSSDALGNGQIGIFSQYRYTEDRDVGFEAQYRTTVGGEYKVEVAHAAINYPIGFAEQSAYILPSMGMFTARTNQSELDETNYGAVPFLCW